MVSITFFPQFGDKIRIVLSGLIPLRGAQGLAPARKKIDSSIYICTRINYFFSSGSKPVMEHYLLEVHVPHECLRNSCQ